ncbi:MAG: hypothetical protein H0X41_14390 [Chitinophagaceae bacterium]|nr:hypothetical protein [Chitinophagaceae bacterium]
MRKKKDYPYLDVALKSRPGERWKAIPGLEGYFVVSSQGRIKRLEYETTYKNGAVYIKPEKIIKPEIRWHHNKFKNDYTAYLAVRVAVAKSVYNFTLARLVYCTFRKTFDYYDYSRVIFYEDGDTLNAGLSNLHPATYSEKQKRIKLLGRSPNPFYKLTPKQVRARHWHMLQFHLKKIHQYNLKGKKIGTYSSIADAHRATGCNATCISRNAKGHLRSSGGYLWKYD